MVRNRAISGMLANFINKTFSYIYIIFKQNWKLLSTITAIIAGFISIYSGLVGIGFPIPTIKSTEQSTIESTEQSTIKSNEQAIVAVESFVIKGKWDNSQGTQQCIKILKDHEWKFSDVDKNFVHNEIGEYNIVFKDHESIILTFCTKPDGYYCHVCQPSLSFFEYEKTPQGWNMTNKDIDVIRAGNWGDFTGELNVMVIAENTYGVFIRDGSSGQGYSYETVQLFAHLGDSFRSIFKIAIEEDSSGAKSGNHGWHSTITFIPTKTGFYDLLIERFGNNGPKDLRILSIADEDDFKDVLDSNNRYTPNKFTDKIRPKDIFRFDGNKYIRSDLYK